MAIQIFPTERDIGGSGVGRAGSEDNISDVFESVVGQYNYVVSGFEYSVISGLNISITAGSAMVSGYRVKDDSAQSFTINNSETDAVWYLQLTTSGGLVTGTQFTRVLDPPLDGSSDPSNSVRLFRATTSGGIVTSSEDERMYCPAHVVGEYTGNGISVSVDLGFRPRIVFVRGKGPTNAQIFAISGVWSTGNDRYGVSFDPTGVETTISARLRPRIEVNGFYVSYLSADDNLCENGATYRYLAIR